MNTLDKDKVGKVMAFSTAMMSKHAVDLIKKFAENKGISVQDETLFVKSKDVNASLDAAKEFAKKSIQK